MEVTFTPSKNKENIKRHGVSLSLARDFDIDSAFFSVDDSQDYGEVRYVAIGWIKATLFTFVFTVRNEIVHAISLRKAEKSEQRLYDEES